MNPHEEAMRQTRESPKQLACTRSFAKLMSTWQRDEWSDINVWNAMDAYKAWMDAENKEFARRRTDDMAGIYGYPPRERVDTTPPWDRVP